MILISSAQKKTTARIAYEMISIMISKYPVLDRHACIHEEDGGTRRGDLAPCLRGENSGEVKSKYGGAPAKNKRGHPSDGPAALIIERDMELANWQSCHQNSPQNYFITHSPDGFDAGNEMEQCRGLRTDFLILYGSIISDPSKKGVGKGAKYGLGRRRKFVRCALLLSGRTRTEWVGQNAGMQDWTELSRTLMLLQIPAEQQPFKSSARKFFVRLYIVRLCRLYSIWLFSGAHFCSVGLLKI